MYRLRASVYDYAQLLSELESQAVTQGLLLYSASSAAPQTPLFTPTPSATTNSSSYPLTPLTTLEFQLVIERSLIHVPPRFGMVPTRPRGQSISLSACVLHQRPRIQADRLTVQSS